MENYTYFLWIQACLVNPKCFNNAANKHLEVQSKSGSSSNSHVSQSTMNMVKYPKTFSTKFGINWNSRFRKDYFKWSFEEKNGIII